MRASGKKWEQVSGRKLIKKVGALDTVALVKSLMVHGVAQQVLIASGSKCGQMEGSVLAKEIKRRQ